MTVFMLMIAEKTPTTSKVTPLIGKFFIASMVIIGLSLIATCIVLNLYECSRSVESVPKIIRIVVLEYLAPFLRVDQPKRRSLTPQLQSSTVPQSNERNGGVQTQMNDWSYCASNHDATVLRQRNVATLPREISEGISILGERARQQDKFETLAEEWQAVAKVADRLFLIVFLITITCTTLYIFVNRPEPPRV